MSSVYSESREKLIHISGRNNDEAKANAQLISKAPEMLAMLKELVCDLSGENLSSSMNDAIKRAEQLIKQATEL